MFKTLKNLLKTFWWSCSYIFWSTHWTIFRGRTCRTSCSYQVWFCWCAFVDCLCGMWLYVDAVWLCVRVSWALVWVMSGHGIPWLDITRTRTQDTRSNRRHRHTATYHTNNQRMHNSGIRPGNCMKYGICAPPEDGLMGRPEHVGATSPKCFKKFLSVLNVGVSWCFYTICKCMSWIKQ
jgi:hypothetical protein